MLGADRSAGFSLEGNETLRDDPRDSRLDPEQLLAAFHAGAFPLGDPLTGEVSLYTCDPRAILPLNEFRTPRGARRKLARGTFVVTIDREFEAVMRACATDRGGDNVSWITESMIACYVQLHALGHAHSVETWRDGRLVGGLYGVSLGSAFLAESMFSRLEDGGSDASSAALGVLVERLIARGFTLFDCQYANDHTLQLGVIEIPEDDYLTRLAAAVSEPPRW